MAKDNKGRRAHINQDAKDFASLTFKKFKKRNGEYYDSKKELRYSYFMTLLDLFPKTIEFVVKYGYIQQDEIQQAKVEIYRKLNDPDFIKILKKEIKNGNRIDNIKLLPIAIKEMLAEAKRVNDEAIAANPNAKIYDMSDLIELSQMILKKKMKKMEKAGISSNIAFDVLSIIPCTDALASSQFYRIHSLYECLYEHAKSSAIPFAELMDILVGEEYYPVFITFALLERKEKFGKLTDNQKSLYVNITSWCFNIMEKLSKEEIQSIVKTFVAGRKRDEGQGRDSNRRYSLSSLSEVDYPRISKVITKMIADDDSLSKYL